MSFNSVSFIIFLPLVAWVYFALPGRLQYLWLFAASLFFYLSGDVRNAAGLAFCIVTTYAAGLFIGKVRGAGRKWAVFLCVAANVSSLLLFRYLLPGSPFAPLGISFFSLQAMGYVVDVYRGRTAAEKNPARYAVFVAFFPTILSGPIQRSTDLLAQIREGRTFDYDRAHSGLYYLLYGYLLKIVMANQLEPMVEWAYGSYDEMPGATLLWATVLFAVQLYCDFAGYSALAIGTAKMLGFDLKANFSQPYFASSLRDFWSRWHISLSSWLRDYVYIPLGGSRKGRFRTQINLLITFLVSGLWHGGGWNYMVWGVLHGVYRILENFLPAKFSRGAQGELPDRDGGLPGKRLLPGALSVALSRIARALATFALVDFAWLFFRAESLGKAVEILKRIFFSFQFREMTYYGSYLLGESRLHLVLMLLGIAAVFAVDFLHERKISVEGLMARKLPAAARWTVYVALTLLMLSILARNYGMAASTFLYQRF